jgi:Fur family transcriptional regulator, zinc uptake regulator
LGHDHDHHHHEHGDPLAAAAAHCARRGLKLTDMRRHVFEALAAAPGALGAYDIIEALADGGHRRLAPISVYRALDFLMEAGLAHKIASLNAFVACPHLHGADDMVVFLICDSCGRVDEATSDAVSRALSGLAGTLRFAPRGQVIEMKGRCGACGDSASATPA